MSGTLTLRNRQRTRAVNLRALQRLVRALLHDLLQMTDFDLGIYLVAVPEMTRLNETFLHHGGSTDVITFDYTEEAEESSRLSSDKPPTAHKGSTLAASPAPLHGEMFICLDVAVTQARRFRTTWQIELARYIIHGLLHLEGFDDQHPADRCKMKRAEDGLLRQLAHSINLTSLATSAP